MADTTNLPEQLHARPGTEVGTTVQAPYRIDNDAELNANDILLPRIKLVQKMSRVSELEGVDYGAVYVYLGRDDMEPTILAGAPAKGDLGEPVRFYVLDDPRKGWSWTRPDNTLGRGAEYPPLGWVINQDPRKVNRTYSYLLTIPEYPSLPVGFLMYGAWGGDGARFINTQRVLARRAGEDPNLIAYRLQAMKTAKPVQGSEQPFVKAIVGFDKVDAKDKAADIELVQSHSAIVGSSNVTVSEEDIVPQADAEATAVPDLG